MTMGNGIVFINDSDLFIAGSFGTVRGFTFLDSGGPRLESMSSVRAPFGPLPSQNRSINRTDVRNIRDEADRLLNQFDILGEQGLILQNPALVLASIDDLRLALIVASTQVNLVRFRAEAHLLGRAALDSLPLQTAPLSPRGIGWMLTVLDYVFPPKATGQVAIPCGLNGCEVYVGAKKIDFD
jgi:hypothetical protein